MELEKHIFLKLMAKTSNHTWDAAFNIGKHAIIISRLWDAAVTEVGAKGEDDLEVAKNLFLDAVTKKLPVNDSECVGMARQAISLQLAWEAALEDGEGNHAVTYDYLNSNGVYDYLRDLSVEHQH